ncbi:dTDP-4-dehydrorhamnose 3,5-epimerase [Variovorax sp. LjRoot84]|uniref:dTDP-4-dehydrorhamnose 3,5-epimerase n=1 Tax=Variovorax sp. LjRoot84 TaxID=3342340 RepID=UPI003ECDD99C
MSRFHVIDTPLAGLKLIERQKQQDARGFFSRLFCAEELRDAGFALPVSQINHTLTRRTGSVRGMHFQHPPHAEDKLVSCLRGVVFDVAVDLRRGSETFLHWHAETLSADNGRSLLIPKGFAHGFQTLSDDAELLYLHTTPYVPGSEGGLNPTDPALAIRWPLPFADVSERDSKQAHLVPAFRGL